MTIATRFMLLVSGIACLIGIGQIFAQEAAVPQKAEGLIYRRVLVPEGELKSQVRGLLPMKRGEFEERLRKANGEAQSQSPATCRIESAIYQAIFSKDQLIAGTAALTVKNAAEEATWISLDGSQIAITRAEWDESPRRTASLGLSPFGKTVVQVNRSAQLLLEWSAQGAPDNRGGTDFNLSLPPATQSELRIVLPADWIMSADTGLLYSSEELNPDGEPRDRIENVSKSVTWTLELGGSTNASFTIRPRISKNQEPLLLVGEGATHRISPGSLDSEFDLKLDVHEQPLEQIALRVPSSLKISSVRCGEQRLSWQEGAADEAGVRRVIVELPEPLAIGRHALRVATTMPYSFDEQLTIPRMQLEGGNWQSGSAQILSGVDVRVSIRSSEDALQTASTFPDETNQNSAQQFEYYSATATIDIVASRPAIGLQVQSGLSVVVDETQAAATLIADLASAGGSRFEIGAFASRRWIIDSVETVPADLLEDRSITARGPDSQRVAIKLRHPLSERRPVRLIVRARRPKSREGQDLPADFLQMLRFDDVRSENRLVSVSSTDPTVEPRLSTSSQITPRDAATATPAELARFESVPGPIFFETAAQEAVGRLVLRRGYSRSSAEIITLLKVSRNLIEEEVQILLRPESTTISSALVRSSPSAAGELVWSVQDDSQAIGLKQTEFPGEPDANESLWELQFRPRSTPIRLVGRRAHSFPKTWSAPLYSLPEATTQTGVVQVQTSDETSLRFYPDGMSSIPLPIDSGDDGTCRGRFRYEPGRRAKLVITQIPAGQSPSKLFVRSYELQTTFSINGASSNIATFYLENSGDNRLSISVPVGASVERILVDDLPISPGPKTPTSKIIDIPLQRPVGQPKVELHYAGTLQPESTLFASRFAVPAVEVSAPCLEKRWNVQLDPSHRYWADNLSDGDGARWNVGRAFNLFSFQDWRLLRNRIMSDGDSNASPLALNSLSRGWRTYQLEIPDSLQASILVYRPASVRVVAISLAIGLFATGSILGRRRGAFGALMVVSLLSLLAMWLLPSPLTPIAVWLAAAGGFAAAFISLRSPLLRPRNTLATPAEPPRTQLLSTVRSFIVALLVVNSVSISRTMFGAEDAATKPDVPRVVVIPVDDRQEPTGDYVYASEDVYEALHVHAQNDDGTPLPWLIRAAKYEGTVVSDESTLQPRGCEVTAVYELETFREGTHVLLPVGNGEIHLVESESTLDGQQLTSSWNAGRDVLNIEVPRAGRHRIELSFAVAFQRQNDMFFCDLAIPKVPQCSVQITADSERGDCEIVGALGAQSVTDDSETTAINLGPAERLRVQYRLHAQSPQRVQTAAVSQLVWWEVKPGSVLANGRFEFSAAEGELREITLRIDPRVKLLPLDSEAGIARQWIEEGLFNTVHLELAPPYPTDAALHATFLLAGAAGSGNFTPPVIEAIGNRTGRDWRAVSVAPGWEVEGIEKGIDPEVFARAWGGSPEQPQVCWEQNSTAGVATVLIRPVSVEPRSKEQLDYSFGTESGRLQYQANVDLGSATRLSFLLGCEAGLTIRNVEVRGAEGPLPVQWWQAADGTLSVNLSQPAPDAVQLNIDADLSLSLLRQRMRLPMLSLLHAAVEASEVRLFQRAGTNLQVEQSDGFSSVDEGPVGGHVEGLGRLSGHFISTTSPGDRKLILRVVESSPELEGRIVTAVYSKGSTWEATLHCDLLVRNGLVDLLRFELPANWNGPFEIEPAVEHSLISVPGQGRQQLLVRPQQPTSERFKLQIKSVLSGATSETVRAPDIELLDAPEVIRYVALAGGMDSKVNWETAGLQVSSAGSEVLPATAPSQRWEVFEIVAPQFEATAGRVAGAAEQPSVSLSDVYISSNLGRRYHGIAIFNLHPAGLTDCTLALPSDCQLASVTLDGRPVETTRVGNRAVRIDLARRRIPVQLRAIFIGRVGELAGSSAQAVEFAAPQLEGLPVARSFWTITSPDSVDQMCHPSKDLRTTALRQDLERLSGSLAFLREGVGAFASTFSEKDLHNWLEYWNREFEGALAAVKSHGNTYADGSESAADLAQAFELQRVELLPTGFRASAVHVNSVRIPDQASSHPATYLAADGALPAVRMTCPSKTSDKRSANWALPGIVAVVALACVAMRRQATVVEWAASNGWLLLALSGIAIWFTLPMGVIGWLVVAIAVVFAASIRQWRTGRHTSQAFPMR